MPLSPRPQFLNGPNICTRSRIIWLSETTDTLKAAYRPSTHGFETQMRLFTKLSRKAWSGDQADLSDGGPTSTANLRLAESLAPMTISSARGQLRNRDVGRIGIARHGAHTIGNRIDLVVPEYDSQLVIPHQLDRNLQARRRAVVEVGGGLGDVLQRRNLEHHAVRREVGDFGASLVLLVRPRNHRADLLKAHPSGLGACVAGDATPLHEKAQAPLLSRGQRRMVAGDELVPP